VHREGHPVPLLVEMSGKIRDDREIIQVLDFWVNIKIAIPRLHAQGMYFADNGV
jgi:hypothetical protein